MPPSDARNETRTTAVEPAAPPPGAFLRQARERRGVSLRQIAATTKISLMALEALERGDAARLPGGIFTRAFVRAYAREVGLDPDAAVRDFLAQCPAVAADEEPAGAPYEPDIADTEGLRHSLTRVWRLVGVVVPVALVVAYFWFSGRPEPSGLPEPPAAPAVSQPIQTLPAPGGDTTGPQPALEPPPSPGAAAPAAPVADPTANPPNVPTAADEVPEARVVLRLSPTEDCWVWWRADGGEAEQQLMRAGEAREIRARDEIVLTLGNAGAMVFSLNGQPGRQLGGFGVVVKDVRITPQNSRSFLSGPQR